MFFSRSKHPSSSRVLHHDSGIDPYKDSLSKIPLGGRIITDDYPLTALPLHATVEAQRRVAADGSTLNDYTYVWEAPGHCGGSGGTTGRFGAIAMDSSDECCLGSCNTSAGGGVLSTEDKILLASGSSHMLPPPQGIYMSTPSTDKDMSPCTNMTVMPAVRKQVEVDYSVKCGTLSTHVPTSYRGCSLCGDIPQRCLHHEQSAPDVAVQRN